MVAVLDRHGRPLMPCHPARARELLAKGRAVVARHTPFVIRLKDRDLADSEVAGVTLRIDPGSKGTGIATTTDVQRIDTATGELTAARKGLLAIQLDHRGAQIKAKLEQRSNCRRRRRSANLRYRAPRFLNRTKPAGWLAPSLQHRVDATTSWAGRLSRWFPVAGIEFERVSFDVSAMGVGVDLAGVEYQRGTLFGYEVRQFLLEKWGRSCVYCAAEGVPLQVEHIRPKARGGSDRISNLTLACEKCNQAKGARPVEEFLAGRPTLLAKILRQAKAPLRDAAAMNATRWALWRELRATGLPVRAWSGGRTKFNRHTQGVAKSHTLDALCVGELGPGVRIVRHPAVVLTAKATGRGRYRRTDPDAYGFPRKTNPRVKQHFGFATGDMVRAVVPSGKKQGTHVGRVAVRAIGNFNITTMHGTVQGIHHRHVRLLQRADGYGYTTSREVAPPMYTHNPEGFLPALKDGASAPDFR
jgi:5-methylcytosine-specific restriction endonuclease McrA